MNVQQFAKTTLMEIANGIMVDSSGGEMEQYCFANSGVNYDLVVLAFNKNDAIKIATKDKIKVKSRSRIGTLAKIY